MSATITAPSGSSYTKKQLTVTISLGKGTFGNTGASIVTLSNLRIKATVTKSASPAFDSAEIRIYGVQPSIMNAVSTLGIFFVGARLGNLVTLSASEGGTAPSVVFHGYLNRCWQDFSEAPETALQIISFVGYEGAIRPVPPTSYPGTADVAQIMSGLALTMGMKFENNGVQAKVSNGYYPGSARNQADQLARDANIEMYIDSGTTPNTLAIWPKSGTRIGQIPLISVTSGSINYPKYQSNGMSFTTLFNPNIRVGGQIQMQSTVGQAAQSLAPNSSQPPADTQTGGPNGLWYVAENGLTHELSSELPGGPWFTEVSCVRVPGVPSVP